MEPSACAAANAAPLRGAAGFKRAARAQSIVSVLSCRRIDLALKVAGYSYEEIGQRLDMSVVTVRGKLARARATVVREMEGWR